MNVQQKISKYQGVLNHVDKAMEHWSEAMHLLNDMMDDMRRGYEYMSKHRDWLTRAIADDVAAVDTQLVEQFKQQHQTDQQNG